MTASDTGSATRPLHDLWSRMGPGKKAATAIIGVIVAVNLGLAGLQSVIGGSDPGGPVSSSYTTDDDGLAAWADLLAARGHPVSRLRDALAGGRLDQRSTLVIVDPEGLTSRDVEAAARFVGAGGRVVLGGGAAAPMLRALTGEAVRWTSDGTHRAGALVPVPETAGVSRVEASGVGRYEDAGGLLPVLGARSGNGRRDAVLAVVGSSRRGVVVGLADPGIVHNGLLARADNAAFALGIVGPSRRQVVFAESVHGFGSSTGLAALPSTWKWTALWLLMAATLGMWSFGQRLGPAEDDRRRLRPPRQTYVDAIAADLARARPDPRSAALPLVLAGRRQLHDRLHLPADAADGDVRAAAAAAGLAPDEVEPLLVPPTGDDDLLAVGRAVARGREERA